MNLDMNTLGLIVSFIVPGLIIAFTRNQFLTGRDRPHSENLLTYLTISLIYYAFTFPLMEFITSQEAEWYWRACWFGLIIIVPILIGVGLGFVAQNDVVRTRLQKFGLNLVHVFPSAWDWKFSQKDPVMLVITLIDGSKVAGLYGNKSFTSSDPLERDVYLEETYKSVDDVWTKCDRVVGIYVPHKEIRYIEVWS